MTSRARDGDRARRLRDQRRDREIARPSGAV